ncbi:squamosa promoter binding [Chlorella sorokiniana]|uniref:Squamosa promoter binding n=1 Tax=Chlorella sorokiniana TaxID=3076 RepID=A0A2P6U4S2_CHLSO|nr:squamosa promoter binding [Chlorella sorokiniana]|eukprot:PRW61318.1 squamosa promoter binding [Chlorella sorokiniana]
MDWSVGDYDWDDLAAVAAKREGRPRAEVRCQVEGCTADMQELRPFYQRLRICETHAKAHSITDASGRAMRFCQQCSKLQPLKMFEGGHRSCAASLDKRRARRSLAVVARRRNAATSDTEEEEEEEEEEEQPVSRQPKRRATRQESGSASGSAGSNGEHSASQLPGDVDDLDLLLQLSPEVLADVLLADCDSHLQAAGSNSAAWAGPQAGYAQAGLPGWPGQQGGDQLVTLCIKLFGATPDQLPADLQAQLQMAMTLTPTVLQATLRHGCLCLTVTALLSPAELERMQNKHPSGFAASVAAAVAKAQAASGAPDSACKLLVQAGSQLAAAGTQRCVVAAQPLPDAPGSTAARLLAAPRLITPHVLCSVGGSQPIQLVLVGPGLADPSVALHCRSRGRHQVVTMLRVRRSAAAAGSLQEPATPPPADRRSADSGLDSNGEDEWAPSAAGPAAADSSEASAPTAAEVAFEAATLAPGEDALLVQLSAPAQGWGLCELETAAGPLLSRAVPLLVLPPTASAAADELAAGLAGLPPSEAASLLLHLGFAMQAAELAPRLQEAAVQRVSRLACALALACGERSWVSAARLLLPAIALAVQPGEGCSCNTHGQAAGGKDGQPACSVADAMAGLRACKGMAADQQQRLDLLLARMAAQESEEAVTPQQAQQAQHAAPARPAARLSDWFWAGCNLAAGAATAGPAGRTQMIVQAAGASEQAVGPAAVEQAPADAPVPPATSAGPILCQVPGCNTNLVGLAQFYRRVRICETHGKAHSITDASGHAMRFCQQCSKLQPLELFSGDRRSCATSLDKRRARRSVAAAGVRASGEASPGRESVERKRRSNQGSPDAEESPGQLGLSKRHSPLRDSGSLTWSMDSFGEERAHSQPQLAPSSGRGGSSLGSPGLSMHGWPVSSEEGAPSGGAPAAATPVWQLSSCGSPMPSFVLGGEASVQAPPPLPALLQHSVRPALQAAQPAVATSRLLPHPHTPAAGAASGRPVSEVPALVAMPLPLAEQLALQMHLSTPAAQPALPAAQLAVPAANATDAELLDWLATEDAHLLSGELLQR